MKKNWAIFEKDNATYILKVKKNFVRKDANYLEKLFFFNKNILKCY